MPKQLMSFRLDDSIVNYLHGVVKNTELSMTQYIEGLIEMERDCTVNTSWSKGCVILSDGRLVVINGPYHNAQIAIIENGMGIIAAIPDRVIPLERCLELAVAQKRKDEDVTYMDDKIHSVDLEAPRVFASYLADLFGVDVKAEILG